MASFDWVVIVSVVLMVVVMFIWRWYEKRQSLRFLKGMYERQRQQAHALGRQQHHRRVGKAIRKAKWHFQWAEIPEEDKKEALALLAKADKAHQDGDTQAALDYCRQAHKYDPSFGREQRERALADIQQMTEDFNHQLDSIKKPKMIID